MSSTADDGIEEPAAWRKLEQWFRDRSDLMATRPALLAALTGFALGWVWPFSWYRSALLLLTSLMTVTALRAWGLRSNVVMTPVDVVAIVAAINLPWAAALVWHYLNVYALLVTGWAYAAAEVVVRSRRSARGDPTRPHSSAVSRST